MLGVVNEGDEVASADPPDAAAYQSMVSPAPGVAEIVTVPVPQRDPFVPVGAAGGVHAVAVAATEAVPQILDSCLKNTRYFHPLELVGVFVKFKVTLDPFDTVPLKLLYWGEVPATVILFQVEPPSVLTCQL